MSSAPSASSELSSLQSAAGVRQASKRVLDYVASGKSAHFTIELGRLEQVVDVVAEVTLEQYAELDTVPFHSRIGHFDAGHVPRLAALEAKLQGQSLEARRRCLADLIITSVLLDAGAGPSWSYSEKTSGQRIGRSEGLAVASYWWFMNGGFSSCPETDPLRADGVGLERISEQSLSAAFQVRVDNPLVGVLGRVALLQRLGKELTHNPWFAPHVVSSGVRRPSDVLSGVPIVDGKAQANDVLTAVLSGFGGVWPGRETLDGVNLGDVWRHSQLGFIPFHKLSQWLSYSLCDALQRTGVLVTALDELTGLAEYRNGGLFLDLEVIVPKSAELLTFAHQVSSDVVIEWRALTVALLDLTAGALRARWGKSAEQLPLVKVLEGGTWRAGRKLAGLRRADAGPPLAIVSDGTVF
jgi:Protein of unknown function (DUF1688)